MKVEVTVDGKPLGKHPVGAKLYLNPVQARALVALKRVTYTKDEITLDVAEVAELPRRRTYRTRAIKAE